jgi:hypothetical protein
MVGKAHLSADIFSHHLADVALLPKQTEEPGDH